MKKGEISESTLNIIELTKKGLSVPLISKEMRRSKKSIWAVLKLHNIKCFPHEIKRDDPLIETYFDEIDSERKAYFFGLLYADGNVFTGGRRNKVSISLQEEDGYLVNELAKELKSCNKISIRIPINKTWKKQVSISINSKRLVNGLIKNNCIPKKSLIKEFPNIEKRLFGHFLRGYFDGNGCIHLAKKGNWVGRIVSIASSIKFLDTLKNILESEYFIRCCKIEVRKNGLGVLKITNKDGVIKFGNIIYQNDTISCKRKKSIFL